MRVLDGKALSRAVAHHLKARVEKVTAAVGRKPALATVLVGDNPASKTYVASKHRFAHECGLETFDAHLSSSASGDEISAAIRGYNDDDRVDGILLQLPLPAPHDGAAYVRQIAPEKDADGLHPVNQGLLLQGAPAPRPCTPLGVMTMIDLAMSEIEPAALRSLADLPKASLAGLSAVVIGRSQLVGKPMAFLLLERNATVTVAHSKTKDLPGVCRAADIVVAAVGVPTMVRGDWVRPGAIVIDVGINRLESGKLVGDVAYDEVAEVAGALTPVPGGVGPMTVSMLIANTVDNCIRRKGLGL